MNFDYHLRWYGDCEKLFDLSTVRATGPHSSHRQTEREKDRKKEREKERKREREKDRKTEGQRRAFVKF